MPAIIIDGNLLDSTATYICHQCNCVTRTSKGLAKAMYERFPYADVYKYRRMASEAGTIGICGNGDLQRYVINIFGQYLPGKPSVSAKHADHYQPPTPDTELDRLGYFCKALAIITSHALVEKTATFAFPWKIGCGLAGGDWGRYHTSINALAEKIGEERVEIWRYQQ